MVRGTLSVPRFRPVTLEQGLYVLILTLAFLVRIWDIGSRAMHGDEAVHAWTAWNLYSGAGYHYDPIYHGPLQFLITSALFFFFGDSDATGRLLAVLVGTTLVAAPYFVRQYMGRGAALVASALIALSPAFVYTSRLERDDILTCFFAMVMAIAMFSFLRTRKARYVYAGLTAAALSLTAMENTYITLFIFGGFVIIALISERVSRTRLVGLLANTGSRWLVRRSFVYTVLIALLGALCLTVWQDKVAEAFVFVGLPPSVGSWTVAHAYIPILILLGLVILFLAGRQAAFEATESGEPPFMSALRLISPRVWLNAVTLALAIVILAFSTFGTSLAGVWDAGHSLLNGPAGCAGNHFLLNPCRKDIIGGLFYWLSQHSVHRGGQPWFYYTFLFGLYEQIVMVFGLAGLVWYLRRPTLFSSFLVWWAVLSFGIYSWAGEKFPWLMVHPLLPFTLLAAMCVTNIAGSRRRIKYLLLAVLALFAAAELHNTFEVNFVDGADPVEMMVYVQNSPQTLQVAQSILSISNKVTNGDTLHVSIDAQDTWPFAWYLRHMPNVLYRGYPLMLKKPYSTYPVIVADETHQVSLSPKLGQAYSGRRYVLRWWFPEGYKSLTWSTFRSQIADGNRWKALWLWMTVRKQLGPKGEQWFYYYVRKDATIPVS